MSLLFLIGVTLTMVFEYAIAVHQSFLRHFGPQAWSGQNTKCILSLNQRPLMSCGVCTLYANTTPPAYPETAPSLWVWNSALKWSSWAPESKPRQDHGDGRTSTKDKMWTTIPFGITPDFFLSLSESPSFWCVHVPWLFKIRTRKQPQILLGLATALKVSDNGTLPEAGLKPLVIYLLTAPLASKSAFFIACVWFLQS